MHIRVWNDTPPEDDRRIEGTCTFTCKDGPAGVETGDVAVPGHRRAPWGDYFDILLVGGHCVGRWVIHVDIFENSGRLFRRHTLPKAELPGTCWPDVKLMVRDDGIHVHT